MLIRCAKEGCGRKFIPVPAGIKTKKFCSRECRVSSNSATNREAIAATGAAWRASHRGRVRANAAAYNAANPEKVRAAKAAWWAANPEKAKVYYAARRAKTRGEKRPC